MEESPQNGRYFKGNALETWTALLEEQSLSSLAINQLNVLLRDSDGLDHSFLLETINKDKCIVSLHFILVFLFLHARLIAPLFYLADLEQINLDLFISASCYDKLSPSAS